MNISRRQLRQLIYEEINEAKPRRKELAADLETAAGESEAASAASKENYGTLIAALKSVLAAFRIAKNSPDMDQDTVSKLVSHITGAEEMKAASALIKSGDITD